MQDHSSLAITRVVNACALLELGGEAVLTDPYFDHHWFMRFREPIGLRAAELPRLTAVLGGHSVFDHWQPRSLGPYPHKAQTPVFTATAAMAKKAVAAGFERTEVLPWGAERQLSERLTLEVAPAQTVTGLTCNNYVLASGGLRVFVGTEARDLEALRRYRAARPPVDVAMLPIDGSSLGPVPLVMNARQALEGARILGARRLVPFHYALRSVLPLLWVRSSLDELLRLAAADEGGPEVVGLKPGQRWTVG